MSKVFKKLLIGLLCVFICSVSLFAEDDDADVKEMEAETEKAREWVFHNNALGISAMGWNSPVVIAGLEYQHWFDWFGLEACFGGNYNPKTQIGRNFVSIGVQPQFMVFKTNTNKPFCTVFYLWLMGGCSIYQEKKWEYESPSQVFVNACVGIGIGAELIFWQRMSIPIQFGFAGDFPNEGNLGFSGSIGLRLRF